MLVSPPRLKCKACCLKAGTAEARVTVMTLTQGMVLGAALTRPHTSTTTAVAASQAISHSIIFDSHLPTRLDVCCSCVKGPSLYLHYDAADNLVQARICQGLTRFQRCLWSCREVLDGMKDFWLYDPFQAAQL